MFVKYSSYSNSHEIFYPCRLFYLWGRGERWGELGEGKDKRKFLESHGKKKHDGEIVKKVFFFLIFNRSLTRGERKQTKNQRK